MDPEDTALLASLLREGKGYGQIARKMNRSSAVIRVYANRPQPEPRRHHLSLATAIGRRARVKAKPGLR